MKESGGTGPETAPLRTTLRPRCARFNDPVASAESAAPASIANAASIVTVDAKGAMKVLRKGTNGWTCMPDAPDTPGPDPMCFDPNAGKWVQAWVAHKPPPANAVGLMYMLEGGTDASNTDPYAKQPTVAEQLGQDRTAHHDRRIEGDPCRPIRTAGKPDTSVPYVMWAGTPYEHLMVPVKIGTRTRASS